MYGNSTIQRALIIGAAGLLLVVGLVAVTHRTDTPVPGSGPYGTAGALGNPEPVSRDFAPAPTSSEPVVAAVSPFANDPETTIVAVPPPSAVPRTSASAPLARGMFQVVPSYEPAPPPRAYYYQPARRHAVYVHRHERSFKRSAEIVGGSAAGGALIGALAGGGKGAAVGALAGGAGGYVYDRGTRHH